MKCKKTQKLLIAYLDNELSTRKQNTVQSHLVQCPVCSAELESYKKLNGIIEQFPKIENRSSLYWQNQIQAIEQKVAEIGSGRKPEPAIQYRWRKPVWGKLAAVSATISVVAIILFINIINQPATIILPKPTMMLAEKPAASIAENTEKEIMLQPTRVKRPTAPIDSMNELKDTNADIILSKEVEKSAPVGKLESAGVGITGREIAAAPVATVPTAPTAVAEEPKYGKGAFPISKAKAAGSYANSTISEFGLGQVAIAGDTHSEGMGLARGTSVFFAKQQAEQVALYDRGTVTPASSLAIQSTNALNLAFDSAQRKLMQEAMEMMVKTNSPDQQNQRMIEIREIPQAESSSPRHLQIKMEFPE